MKIFKRKHFQALIYSIFLALPLLSVLGRCVYTIVNKNAKDSYYGDTINEVQLEGLNALSDIEVNREYLLSNDEYITYTNVNTLRLTITDIVNNTDNYDYSSATRCWLYSNVYNENYNMFLTFYDSNNTQIRAYNLTNTYVSFNFTITAVSYTGPTAVYFLPMLQIYTYNEYSYLDNAFEYSIDRFVSENDYGNFDFFQWFSTFFLSNTSINNLYIHFVNWYLNYVLYVSLGYLIFSVLFWFVNFFRRLVEDTQNINVGGM